MGFSGVNTNRWLSETTRLVLVVDDDATTCALAQAYLQLEGYRVKTAVNGLEALAVLRDCVPCAIVVDLRMPLMDAAELRQRQLAMASVADVPFILMSASATLQEAAVRLGASDVLIKPFENEELKAAIEHVCGAGPL
jgi:CheY-like chemotaxis protein